MMFTLIMLSYFYFYYSFRCKCAWADLFSWLDMVSLAQFFSREVCCFCYYNGKFYVVNVVKFYAYHINIPSWIDGWCLYMNAEKCLVYVLLLDTYIAFITHPVKVCAVYIIVCISKLAVIWAQSEWVVYDVGWICKWQDIYDDALFVFVILFSFLFFSSFLAVDADAGAGASAALFFLSFSF